MSNVVATALTLCGPRLWLLIKRLGFEAFALYVHWKRNYGSSASRRHLSTSDNAMELIEESHSELGAALMLLKSIFLRLRPRIELAEQSIANVNGAGGNRRTERLKRIWETFLSKPFDIGMSVLLSLTFVGIFVAGTSGSVLSAGIVGDTTALASSEHCFPPDYRKSNVSLEAASYSQRCYKQPAGTEGCGYLYNQDIFYSERSSKKCPLRQCQGGVQKPSATNHIFTGEQENDTTNIRESAATSQASMKEQDNGGSHRKHSAITLDTGLVDASVIGINAPKRYQFRRTTTCAPSRSSQNEYQSVGIGGFVSVSPVFNNSIHTIVISTYC